MIHIEQRIVGSSNLQSVCERFAPGGHLDVTDNLTGYLAMYGLIAHAVKIRHVRPDGSIRFVLEILERIAGQTDKFVILTLDRDFTGKEALEAYRMYRSLPSPAPGS